jgi:hypothetical protein
MAKSSGEDSMNDPNRLAYLDRKFSLDRKMILDAVRQAFSDPNELQSLTVKDTGDTIEYTFLGERCRVVHSFEFDSDITHDCKPQSYLICESWSGEKWTAAGRFAVGDDFIETTKGIVHMNSRPEFAPATRNRFRSFLLTRQ